MLDPLDFSIAKLSSLAGENLLQVIESCGSRIKFSANSIICTRGTPAEYIYYIEQGLVQVGISSEDGSYFHLTRLGPGHSFGEMASILDLPVIHDATAKTEVTIIAIRTSHLINLLNQTPDLSLSLLKVAYSRLYVTLSHVGDTLNATLSHRVAKLINTIYESSDRKDQIVHCRQIDLGHGLGVSRVSIGKSLKELQNIGLIKLKYGKIIIINTDNLQNFINQTSYHI